MTPDPRKRVGRAALLYVGLRCFTALAELIKGTATIEEWHDVCEAMNGVEVLCTMGKIDSAKFMPIVIKAQQGMVQASRNQQATGTMTLSSESHLFAIRECVTEYESAIGRFSQWTIAQASAEVVMRTARAKPEEVTA